MTTTPPSLLLCVGEQYYTLSEFVDEAHRLGVSKRIPAASVPEGLVPGISKIFVAHPKAIIKTTASGYTLLDLAYTLHEEGVLTYEQYEGLVELESPFWTGEQLQSEDFVPGSMFVLAYAFSKSERQKELTEAFGLKFCMGIFGFGPFGGFQYVAKSDEDGLPEGLTHLEGYVEPVHVVYDDADDYAGTDDDLHDDLDTDGF